MVAEGKVYGFKYSAGSRAGQYRKALVTTVYGDNSFLSVDLDSGEPRQYKNFYVKDLKEIEEAVVIDTVVIPDSFIQDLKTLHKEKYEVFETDDYLVLLPIPVSPLVHVSWDGPSGIYKVIVRLDKYINKDTATVPWAEFTVDKLIEILTPYSVKKN